MTVRVPVTQLAEACFDTDEAAIDQVFFALADPVRRRILEQLDLEAKLVSELAAPFAISLQAVSRHIQVLVRAGLVRQQRTGRISRCSLVAGPIFPAAVWLNRYSKYWQEQFGLLAIALEDLDQKRSVAPRKAVGKTRRERTRT
jgi:DNA-binding transcriptional ArsR family regulator